MKRFVTSAWVLWAMAAWAHDVSFDLTGSTVAKSENNPRSGSLRGGVSGSYDLNDAWSVFAGFTYTRDLATKTATSSSAGANIFLINAGALFVPTEHLMFMASANFSPTVAQDNATTITFGGLLGLRRDDIDLVVHSSTTSGGANVMASYFTGGFGTFTHTADLFVGVTTYNTYQQLNVPPTMAGLRWRGYCAMATTAALNYCPLVNGVISVLAQSRLGAGYTLTVKRRLDLGLEGAVYLYSEDPNSVGYFSVLQVGRLPDLGGGVPVAPYLFTGRFLALYRFEKLTLRLTYQFGQYTGTSGANHLVTVRAGFKITPSFKLSLTLAGQGDATPAGFANRGAQATVAGVLTF